MIYQRPSFLSPLPKPLLRATTMEQAIEDFTLPGSISNDAAYAFGNSALRHDPLKVDWTNLHEFNECNPAKICVPSLVIHGDNDPYLVKDGQMGLFSGISSSDKSYSILPGADHCAHLIGARYAFAQCVVSFIKRPISDKNKNIV